MVIVFCCVSLDCVEIGGVRGWLFVAVKNAQIRGRNGEGGEKDRASSHKLNIIDNIISMVTPSAILSVEMSRHHMIYLLESRCITICNVASIY